MPIVRPKLRRTLLGLSLALACRPVVADDFVDVLSEHVWAKKGSLACDSRSAAAENGAGLFSGCVRLPIAFRVKLVDSADPPAMVYFMRVAGDDGIPKYAWFSRESLTNNPRPWEFRPGP